MSLQSLERRVSVRKYEDRAVPDSLVAELVAAAQRAPTSNNLQPVSLIEVTDPAVRQRIAVISGDQAHVVSAARFFIVCADLTRVDLACAVRDVAASLDFDLSLQAVVDGSIFGAHLAVCAEAVGLGTVMVGGVRNDISAISRLLALPQRCTPLFGLCMGWPAERPVQKPRFPANVILHQDRYSAPSRALVDAYDARLSDYYRVPHAWSARVAKALCHPSSRGTLAAFRRARLLDV